MQSGRLESPVYDRSGAQARTCAQLSVLKRNAVPLPHVSRESRTGDDASSANRLEIVILGSHVRARVSPSLRQALYVYVSLRMLYLAARSPLRETYNVEGLLQSGGLCFEELGWTLPVPI